MKGHEFKRVRKSFDLSEADFMYALGYMGNENTMHLNCRRYEDAKRPIPLYLAQYVWLVERAAAGETVPLDEAGMPVWPEWPAYYEDVEGNDAVTG